MSEYVVDGTQFMCDQCGAPHSVTVPGSPAKGQGKKMASESNSFIPPNGGPCKKILIAGSPTPCALPSKPDSAGQSKLKIAGALAMGSGCKYKCPAGGTLTVLSPGQTKAKAGASAGSAASVASAAVAGVTAAGGGGGDDDDDEEKKDKKKENKATAKKIADGHAYDKHVLGQPHGKGKMRQVPREFPGAMRTRKQFQSHIENVLNNPGTPSKQLARGRSAFWDKEYGSVVIKDPASKDLGTMFQPKNGKAFFDALK